MEKPVIHEEPLVRFSEAYLQWKLRERTTEPTADEFGINHLLADIIASHVHRTFEQSVMHRLRNMKMNR